MKLTGKTVLITGASSGLGRGVALALARRDCNLVVTARREPLLLELAAEIEALGSRCLPVAADGTDAAQSQRVLDQAIERFGGVDVALLNAGGGTAIDMAAASAEDVLQIMRTNYFTLVHLLCPLIAHLKGRGGVIAYTGSPAGYFGLPKSGPYSASKAAGRVLLDTCRIELKGSGIDFVAVYPGFTETPSLDPDEVPLKALVIQPDRAVREIVRAIEKRRSHTVFPRRIRWPIAFGRLLPEPIRRRILAFFAARA